MEARTLSGRARIATIIAVWVTVALDFAIAGIAYALLPDKIPNLWTINGAVNELVDKNITVFILPIAAFVSQCALAVLPHIDPNKGNYARFEKSYMTLRAFISGMILTLVIMHMIRLRFYEYGISYSIFKLVIALYIVLIGNLLPKIKRNYFIGLTNPWSVASEKVWFLTHRFGGRYFMGIGAMLAILSFFEPIAVNIVYWCLIVTLFAVPTVYSFEKYYVRIKKKNNDREV